MKLLPSEQHPGVRIPTSRPITHNVAAYPPTSPATPLIFNCAPAARSNPRTTPTVTAMGLTPTLVIQECLCTPPPRWSGHVSL